MEVEVSEADTGLPETTEQALDMSKERLGAASTQESQPDAGEQPAEAQAADEALEGQTTGDAQSGARKSDFSFVADPALRSALEASQLPAEARAALKAWQADYTRKSQVASEYERKAQAWEALESMPGARKAIADLFAQAESSGQPQAEPEEMVDLTQADNETIWKAIKSEAAKQAKVIAEQMLQERIIAPVSTRQRVIDSAKSLYPDWSERLDEAGFKQAWSDAVGHYGEDAFTPENTAHLFSPLSGACSRQAGVGCHQGQAGQGRWVCQESDLTGWSFPVGYAVIAERQDRPWRQEGRSSPDAAADSGEVWLVRTRLEQRRITELTL